MKRLALLSPFVPTTPLVGGTNHIARAVQQLARRYRIQLYMLADDPTIPIWPPLVDVCESTITFARTPRPLFSLAPPAVQLDCSSDLTAHLTRIWAHEPPDIVQLETTTMAQYAPLAKAAGAFVVCTAIQVAFLAQVRRARQQHGAALKARRWLGALSLWLYELRALACCDLVITLSEIDARTLRRWLPRLRVAYVPSGVDLREQPLCFNPSVRNEVTFVGNYQHPPNVDGALWLVREVWPLVRRARPHARLTLAGRAPTPEIRALAAPDISVPGSLGDLNPLYRQTSVFVAPIFWGSGVRIKILDALAAGLPLVTTAQAAEDIPLVRDQSALFAEQPNDFATAIIRLLDDQTLRTQLGAAGRALVEREYDWEQIGAQLVSMYEEGSKQQ